MKLERKPSDIVLDWTPRPEQLDIEEAFKLLLEEDISYLMVDAPTGVGKSYSAMRMANLWHEATGGKTDVITNSKMLQSQYMRDFPFLAELKGKANYPCSQFGTDCDSGGDLAIQEGLKCIDCPHSMAFDRYMTATVSMLNFHLFSSYAAYVQIFLKNRGATMLIIDEASAFEEVFTDFVSIVLSDRVLKTVGLDDNPVVVRQMNKVKDTETLKVFFNDFFKNRVLKHIKELTDKVHKAKTTKRKSILLDNIKNAERLLARFHRFLKDETQEQWIFQREDKGKNSYVPHIKLEPIWAREYLWNMVYKRYKKVVFMSATILDAEIFSFLNGLEGESLFCQIDSPFDVENRRVYYHPIGRMSFRHKEESIKKMIPAIDRILKKNPDIKGIIHTGNYENARKLQKALGRKHPRLIFHGPGEAPVALDRHEKSKDPTVLVSPAMTHGVDLKDDLSRLQIIMKIPFPSLGDKRIMRRMKQSNGWYNWRTWCEVIQATGRSVRSTEDWAVTYILDASFDQLLKSRHMMPEYFKQALVMPAAKQS